MKNMNKRNWFFDNFLVRLFVFNLIFTDIVDRELFEKGYGKVKNISTKLFFGCLLWWVFFIIMVATGMVIAMYSCRVAIPFLLCGAFGIGFFTQYLISFKSLK